MYDSIAAVLVPREMESRGWIEPLRNRFSGDASRSQLAAVVISDAYIRYDYGVNCRGHAALALVVSVLTLDAQTKESSWSGVLRDESGSAIADAVLRLTTEFADLRATTDQAGHFSFRSIPSGEYSLAIESRGGTAH